LKLSQRLADEAMLQVQSLEKDYSNGKASQADWFAAKTDAGLAQTRHTIGCTTNFVCARGLRGGSAMRQGGRIAESLTMPGTLTPLSGLIAGADHHPVIGNLDKQIEASATESPCKTSYKPELFSRDLLRLPTRLRDFVGIQFKVGLPYFTKNRQDRGVAAAIEQSHASEDRKRDLLRELHTQ